jgi:hypothetical protein
VPLYPPNVTTSYDYSLPLQIGSYITVRDYNTFLDENEKVGYKFCWDRGNVYIVEMATPEHEVAVDYLSVCFHIPNNHDQFGPIEVLGQPCKRFFLLIYLVFGL